MKARIFAAVIIASILFLPVQEDSGYGMESPPYRTETAFSRGLSPSSEYAAEILSFLLRIVLGQEGNPRFRKEWATRGVDEKLDYGRISAIMTDHDASQLDLIVLDPGLHFLTKVLYRYDNRLSEYKGRFDFAGVYPATEVVALRLLLLKKINEGEKINLEELIRMEDLLLDPGTEISDRDLKAVNLSAEEMRFLRDILEGEPRLFEYLKSPFLVRGLVKAGAVKMNCFSREMIESANYKGCRCSYSTGSKRSDAVKIAVLPSIIGEFDFDRNLPGLSVFGFKPTEDLEKIIEKLESDILRRTKQLLENGDCAELSLKGKEKKYKDTDWKDMLQDKLAFYVEEKRPLVITPQNAAEVVADVCPEADFTVILLDKNVYLTINLNEKKDMYPAVPRVYLDIMDIQYSQAEDQIEEISGFICSRLKAGFHNGE